MADDIVSRARFAAWAADEGDPCAEVALGASEEIERLRAAGDRLAEQVLTLLGPLATNAEPEAIERHRVIREGALGEWAALRATGCSPAGTDSRIATLEAESRALREFAIRQLWDARNLMVHLHRSYVRWQKPLGQLTTQADEQALAAARYEEWLARWAEVDDVLDPPGWRFR